jgi:hypothetical protein
MHRAGIAHSDRGSQVDGLGPGAHTEIETRIHGYVNNCAVGGCRRTRRYGPQPLARAAVSWLTAIAVRTEKQTASEQQNGECYSLPTDLRPHQRPFPWRDRQLFTAGRANQPATRSKKAELSTVTPCIQDLPHLLCKSDWCKGLLQEGNPRLNDTVPDHRIVCVTRQKQYL